MPDTTTTPRTAEELETAIVDALGWLTFETPGQVDEFTARSAGEAFADFLTGAHVDTFAGAELLTTNAGVVLRLSNGAEFQIQIVQSGLPR